MIGFVSALSASLAVVILIMVSALLNYVASLIPTTGMVKMDEGHYRYIMEFIFLEEKQTGDFLLEVNNLIEELQSPAKNFRIGCNYGFNKPEREMLEVSTYNFAKFDQVYTGDANLLSIDFNFFNLGLNYCYIDVYFVDIKLEPNDG